MTIFYPDEEPLSKYSPVMLHLSPATRNLNENPVTFMVIIHGKKMTFTNPEPHDAGATGHQLILVPISGTV